MRKRHAITGKLTLHACTHCGQDVVAPADATYVTCASCVITRADMHDRAKLAVWAERYHHA